MRVIDVVSVLFGLAGTAVASPVVHIPEVSSVVSSVTASYAAALLYAGPTGSTSTSKSAAPVATPQAAAVGATPYWLETIKHQGISAFNSNPGSYQVFRNVKDFGAKGWLQYQRNARINPRQVMGSRMIQQPSILR
jgi:glucan 1,3-beta-glucosidase